MADDRLRLAVGIMGNAGSLMLYSAPMLTFAEVMKKKSTEEYSCVPYILALFNCCLYTWYGLPVVSYRWENFPIITINGLGLLFELSFIIIYFCFTSNARKKKVVFMMIPVMGVVLGTVAISTLSLHDHGHRKVFVGSVGLVASVSMYCSPLVAVRRVIKTKSVEFMPFYLSFFSFITSSLWMTYGLLSHDLVLASPNMVGCPLSMLQLLLYCMYRKNDQTVQAEEPKKWDIESCSDNNDEDNNKLKKLEAVKVENKLAD